VRFQQIDIDADISRLIEAERHGFEEPSYVALRRLLKLPEVSANARPWTDEGVVVPHGSRARMEYARGSQVYEGRFLDGKLVVNGQEYGSLSAAANAVAVTRNGEKTSLNGWFYWKVQFPNETEWRSLQDMRSGRKRYRIM
jgi:hypothetical protein